MSFILDALKKSENERQRQIGPSLADIPFRRTRTERPWWAVAVAALLVINLGVLIVVLMRNRSAEPTQPPPAQSTAVQPQTQPAPTSQSSQRPASAPPASTGEPMVSNPAVRSLAEEANADEDLLPSEMPVDSAIAAAAVPDGPPVVRPVAPPSVAPVNTQPAYDANGRAPAQDDNDVLPTLNSLVASGTSLPDMRLDIHVYSPSPAERFVFINMRKYAEGQSLSEGPVVERIRTDGAVLNHRGTRFLLPRQ
jgi:general secretion pathway protein B